VFIDFQRGTFHLDEEPVYGQVKRRLVNISRLKVTNLDDGASRRSLAGSWIELET